ncbi:hypothetical protein jhhlp_007655 [Lomentospora prolificans]|uniref:Uncharacterized protein n=1 Tax=Lomentospora prolificans TaxID=41688 RepID=A0A2N3N070_9PEZI|nr:hypothetical protein jhhlp_007655 [Lomentospora prolificans]
MPFLYSMSGPSHPPTHHRQKSGSASLTASPSVTSKPSIDPVVSQALEIARESPDGASDPTISNILETALNQIWAKVQAAPDSYVMSRDEFSLFNFFQHRFVGDKLAMSARRRYWDHASA